jgi:hypothetical protein
MKKVHFLVTAGSESDGFFAEIVLDKGMHPARFQSHCCLKEVAITELYPIWTSA